MYPNKCRTGTYGVCYAQWLFLEKALPSGPTATCWLTQGQVLALKSQDPSLELWCDYSLISSNKSWLNLSTALQPEITNILKNGSNGKLGHSHSLKCLPFFFCPIIPLFMVVQAKCHLLWETTPTWTWHTHRVAAGPTFHFLPWAPDAFGVFAFDGAPCLGPLCKGPFPSLACT